LNTTFIINGGAGRVISAIPALEKYARQNPHDDFKVLIHGWELLFWSHPILQDRSFSIAQKGAFDLFIRNNRVVCPEPYYIHGYYNQKLSMAEAFDQEINHTTDHSDLEQPHLYISNLERDTVRRLIKEKLAETNKRKLVVIQPYGSGVAFMNGRPYDSSHRSMDADDYLKLVQKLNRDILVVYFGLKELRHPGDKNSIDLETMNPDLRMYLSFISECDYFVGCDSVGQHMARAMNRKGMVLMGSTDETNVSYPNYFKIYRNGQKPVYSPIRLTGTDCEFADRMNDGIMKFTDKQLDEMADTINYETFKG
jgi:hypothetical protein